MRPTGSSAAGPAGSVWDGAGCRDRNCKSARREAPTRRLLLPLIALAFFVVGCSKPGDPADVVGTWVIEPESVDNAAFNMVRAASEHAGKNLADAEIEPVARELAEKLRTKPAEYTVKEDGTFYAVSEGSAADGKWTYTKSILMLDSASARKPPRFRVESGGLTSLSESPRNRHVRMVRKDSVKPAAP